jgi:prevent-host-death family protein
MHVSTKELRVQPGRIIDHVVKGEEIIVTFRGKALAKIIPIGEAEPTLVDQEISIFGMWSNHIQSENVDEMVRSIRQGRQF